LPIEYETQINHEQRQTFISSISFYVKWLMIVNAIIFLVVSIGARFGFINMLWILNVFGQVNTKVFGQFMIWQFVTSMFLHGGIRHLLGNLLYLWIFGTMLEQEWGQKRFIVYYFICGIGAGFLQFCVDPFSTIPGIGASGAIFGLLGACGLLFPNREVYLFMVKVKLKYIVAVFAIIEMYLCLMGTADGIGHWVHISGFVIGIIYIKLKGKLMHRKAVSNTASNGKGRFDNIEL